jgi:hypothetical protein
VRIITLSGSYTVTTEGELLARLVALATTEGYRSRSAA